MAEYNLERHVWTLTATFNTIEEATKAFDNSKEEVRLVRYPRRVAEVLVIKVPVLEQKSINS